MTIQTAEFYGNGNRAKKAVTNSGDFDRTVVYTYDGQKILQADDGSGNMVQQYIHGTQYIDELVMLRVAAKGDLYVHQDANWNVIGLTDLGGSVVERYDYTPYGQVVVNQDTNYGDRDGDGDVDSTDKGTPGSTCTGTVSGPCRILDLDFDGDYDSADAALFDALDQGLARHPGRPATNVDQPFAHQGLLYDVETGSYQNRRRQYDPERRRFVQRDPLGTNDFESAVEGLPPVALVQLGRSEDLWGQLLFAQVKKDALDRLFELGISRNGFNDLWLLATIGSNLFEYGAGDPATNVDPTGLDCFHCGDRTMAGGACCGGCKYCITGPNPTVSWCQKCADPDPDPDYQACNCLCWYQGGLNCSCCRKFVPVDHPDRCKVI